MVSASQYQLTLETQEKFQDTEFQTHAKTTLGNRTKSLKLSKSIEQTFFSAFKSCNKACKNKSNEDFSSKF